MSNYKDELDGVDDFGWKFVKWIFILAAVGSALSFCGWMIHVVFFPVRAAQAVAERTFNADNMIYNYEWFHLRLADYQTSVQQGDAKEAERQQFLASAGLRDRWDIATQREDRQLSVELSGLRQQSIVIANEYNSHVAMANRNLFRERDLPDHLGPSSSHSTVSQ